MQTDVKYGRKWAEIGRVRLNLLALPHFGHYLRRRVGVRHSAWRDPAKWDVLFPLAEQGIQFMRKIILAAAIATSALGLAACQETAKEAGETADAMAADAEANADAATEAVTEGAEAAGETVEAAGEAAAEGVEAAKESAEAAAETATDAAKKATEAAGEAKEEAAKAE
jgi:hypothetical protein